jgi:hypothetical protein
VLRRSPKRFGLALSNVQCVFVVYYEVEDLFLGDLLLAVFE